MANADLAVYGTQLPRLVSANGVSIREDVLYTDAKGEPDQRRRKRAEDALADLQDVLPNLLEPKETILFVIKSCQAPMGALEQFFWGGTPIGLQPRDLSLPICAYCTLGWLRGNSGTGR
jgi:hypothetical protein